VPDQPPRRRSPAERRRENPGRREADRLYDNVCDQLRELRDDLRGLGEHLANAVKELRGLISKVDEDLKGDVEELEGAIEKTHTRITDLERWHIEETAVDRERAAQKMKQNERRSKWSLRVGILAGLVGVAAFVIDHLHH
jgi:DNA anti-recombination protein RmuC